MIDPVCGMEVEESSEFKSNEGGQTTYFCSKECKDKFEKNPNEFMNAAGAATFRNEKPGQQAGLLSAQEKVRSYWPPGPVKPPSPRKK